ncbi:O-antigen ligase family protein [Fictibacillus iocasae]|uniref:O-antigen ligase family protein n=1 Tax=Fictibacillus iocasae TaxID=2715437 RepID=A0ABW2NLP9_9BACL
MKINLQKSNVTFLYAMTLIFVAAFPINFSNFTITIYSSTAASLIFLLLFNYKHLRIHSNDLLLISLILIYTFYLTINAMIIDPSKLIYALQKSLPFYVFILLIITFKKNIKAILLVQKIIGYSLIFCMLSALLLFFLGFSNIYLSSKTIISLISNQYYLDVFGETRLQFMSTHKSRFGVLCIFSLIIILKHQNLNKIFKLLIIVVIMVNLYFSSSYTSLLLAACVLFFCIFNYLKSTKSINKYTKLIMFKFFLIMLFSLILLFFNFGNSKGKDFSNMGDRLYIWQASIYQICNNPWGIVTVDNNFYFKNPDRNLDLKSAHNIILNEGIESGLLGMFMLSIIFLLIFKKLRKDRLLFLGTLVVFLAGMFDIILYENMNYIFWYLIAYFYILSEKSNVGYYNSLKNI